MRTGEFDGDEPSDFSTLWFKAGANADFNINEILYLRGEFLYGIRTHNKVEKNMKDSLKEMVEEIPAAIGYAVNIKDDVKLPLGHGPAFKLAVGYRF